jgi:hypothetical protein
MPDGKRALHFGRAPRLNFAAAVPIDAKRRRLILTARKRTFDVIAVSPSGPLVGDRT